MDPILLTLIIEPPAAGCHSGADQHGESKGALEVHALHLVVVTLGDIDQISIEWRHACIVDEDVAVIEPLVDLVNKRVTLVPVAHMTCDPECRARPVDAAISTAARSHDSSLRLAMTTSAPLSASPYAMALPIPRLPPVTTATLPARSKEGSTLAPSFTRHPYAPFAVIPPSTAMTAPLTKDAAGSARVAIMNATSSGVP